MADGRHFEKSKNLISNGSTDLDKIWHFGAGRPSGSATKIFEFLKI